MSEMGSQAVMPRPLREWGEEDGNVLWWKFPIDEPPYVGTPLDCGHAVEVTVRHWNGAKEIREYVGGWPGYHTHWTPIPIPSEPKP